MKLEGYNNTLSTMYTNSSKSIKEKTDNTSANASTETKTSDDTAVIYEKSDSIQETAKSNEDIIAQLKFDIEQRTNQLYSLVQKMFNKQGITFNTSREMFDILRSGNFTADPETIAQAKKDISEDGYWGVKQTSERLVSFAQALAGNDPEQADKMIAAVKKGFEQATNTWGGELPDICKQTLDTTVKKLEEWRDSLQTNKIESTTQV